MSLRISRVAALLFGSGACALVYQVAWFRELRLVFGASTAASAAVLAVFMGGLGVGGALLGKRADRSTSPLALYGNLELVVALTAALTPLTVRLAESAYLGAGGSARLGAPLATVLRLLLSVVVLAPSTIAMGGTMPAAARAVERARDEGRQRVAVLYGVNTFGAVVGTMLSTFVLLEVFGARLTLWLACLVNLLVGVLARGMARRAESEPAAAPEPAAEPAAPLPFRAFPKVAAAISGFAFTGMELVWYRMLAPILGGSAYTFGLVLAVALFGIGLGGALYARRRGPSTLGLFGATCALEALVVVLPYALGDRVALLAGLLRPVVLTGFAGSVAAWTVVVALVVLPGAIVSGYQFPVLVGLYGRGSEDVGRDLGQAYLANTLGSIAGSLAGGFGLLPWLGAPRAWAAVSVLLAVTAIVAVVLDALARPATRVRAASVVGLPALAALALTTARGPTATWRHAGIGAGRADDVLLNANGGAAEELARRWSGALAWEEDGLESTVALAHGTGYAFIVNGKVDGHATQDADTQVMGGVLPALLHPAPKRALVIGLGTGSSAGWLGAVPSVASVEVHELERAILRVAKDCAKVNAGVMDNPKVHVRLGDARELLRTTQDRYDVVFSEPSNPYRAGVSSLFTREYYTAVRDRLAPGGLFAQWTQAYEVDPLVLATVMTTLRSVFPHVSTWQLARNDLLFVASMEPQELDGPALRERIRSEPFATALRASWLTDGLEGVLAHHVATPGLTDAIVKGDLGLVATDDQNLLEFRFARTVGRSQALAVELIDLASRLGHHAPAVRGGFDEVRWSEESLLAGMLPAATRARRKAPPSPEVEMLAAAAERGDHARGLAGWRARRKEPNTYAEALLVAELAARAGDARGPELVPPGATPATRATLRALWAEAAGRRDEVVPAVEAMIVALREDPWLAPRLVEHPLAIASRVGSSSPELARRVVELLRAPFAVELVRQQRLATRMRLARATRDPRLCLEVVGDLGESSLLDIDALRAELDCLRAAKDPRAEGVLRTLEALTPAPFGSSIGD